MELTERQAQFADAALSVLARRGMQGVSFRSVATEAGMSLGAVQKAFPSKEFMLTAMFHRMRDNASRDFTREPGRPTLGAWLVALMMAVLPLDEARRTAELHGAAFAERIATDPAIGAAVAASDRELTDAIAQLAHRAMAEGEIPHTCDPTHIAHGWMALGQGFASQLLYAPRPEADVRADVAYAVSRLLDTPGEL